MLSGKATGESEFNTNTVNSDSKLKWNDDADISRNSFNKSKRRIRFNSFSSSTSNPLYKRDNSSLFRNYFNDSYEKFVTEDDDEAGTEDTITLNKSPFNNNNSNENSLTLNISKDKLLFNNIQYDSFFIHDIDPFKETSSSQKNYSNTGFTGNILDELKEDEKKDDKYIENSMINPNYYSEKPPSYCFDSPKKESVRFNEEQLNSKNIKPSRIKKGKKGKKNDTTRELLKNKFLKFVKKYASNSNNYSLSDDVEIEKSFYNFYDENFGKNDINYDTSICTYEKNDGSHFNITMNDLFDNRNEFDEFKNSLCIDNDENDDLTPRSVIPRSPSKSNAKKSNTSFKYNSSFVYDHNSFGPGYDDNLNYACYNITTCIGEDFVMNDEEENKKKNENLLSRLNDDEKKEEEKDKNKKTTDSNSSTENKGKTPEKNSKLKENLMNLMESEAFKDVIKDPNTLTQFLKGALIGYVDPKKIDKTKDKLFKMIDNNEIEHIKKFVNNYVDIVEESEDKIRDMREKSIMIETKKNNGKVCTDVIESNPGFIARFNDIMIEKFTNINNAIINFTTELCPQIIKNGFNSIVKSIPFVVSFVSLVPMEFVTSFLSSFPAGQAIIASVNGIIMKSAFLASTNLVLPQIAVIVGCLIYKLFGNKTDENSRDPNNNTETSLLKFMNVFEIFSKHLKNDGGISNTERDPSVITSKVVNAAFKTLMESKELPSMFQNKKVNNILTDISSGLPDSENKLKFCLAVFNDVLNKDNAASKSLFEELINLLDKEKLDDEDFRKILNLIIKESQNLQVTSIEDQKKDGKTVTISSNQIKDNEEEEEDGYNAALDKSYNVIMLTHVLDEIKKSKGELGSENKNEVVDGKAIPTIIREYRLDGNRSDSDLKIKMKRGYEKRSYSLGDKNKKSFFERDNLAEFAVRKNGPKNVNAQLSIIRNDNNERTEHFIPKYYTSTSSSPSASPVVLQRGYSYNDERSSKYSLANKYNGNNSSPKRKNNSSNYRLNKINEWSDEESKDHTRKKQLENFFLEPKESNYEDNIMNNIPLAYNSNSDQTEQNNNKTLDQRHTPIEKSASFSSDDIFEKLLLSNDSSVSMSDESFNKSSISDRSRKSKKSFKDKLMSRFSRSSSKRNTPKYIEWENLPLEIVFNIFKHFSTEERAQLREVSKYFNYILTNPVFYMNINMTAESDTADNTSLLYQWKLSNGYLLSLNLSQCNLISDDVFRDAIDYKIQERKINDKSVNERANLCFNDTNAKFEEEESLVQNLRNLDLSYCSGLYSSKIMGNFFRGISLQADGTVIKKNGCINLEEINLSDLYQILDDNLLISIAESCPKLKTLYISKGYDITNYSVKMILKKCKHLENLKIANCPKINFEAFNTRCVEEISNNESSNNESCDLNLRNLNVSYCRMMEDNLVKMVAENCPYLEELHISGCQNISDEGMKHLVSGRAWKDKRVKVIDISGCYCIGDEGIRTLTPSVLEKLDISDCSFITDTGLRYIFEGMPFLKEIGYENCSGTSSIGRDKLQSKYEILSKTE